MREEQDIADALDHVSDFVDRELNADSFDVERRSMTVDELMYYDDIDAWAEWGSKELAKLAPDELASELDSFRGIDWVQQNASWILSPEEIPPVVVVETPEFATIGDGRGRISVFRGLYGDDSPLPVLILKEKQNLIEQFVRSLLDNRCPRVTRSVFG